MRVLLVHTNIDGYHEDTYSFGLASIVAITKTYGHDTKVFIVHSKKEYSSFFITIDEFSPQIVGFTSVSSQFGIVKELSMGVKERSGNTITVCGGVHPTIYPECILECNSLDGIFVGESELSFVEFLRKLETGKEYHDTNNFAYGDKGKLIMNSLRPLVRNLEDLPFPDKTTYRYQETIIKTGYAPFKFTRGCPFLCSYCSNHAIAKVYGMKVNTPRYRNVESSIQEIEETLRLFPEIETIIINDDIFGIDKKWRHGFCEMYKERIPIKFQCLLRANVVSEDFIEELKQAGCYRISFGVESGNDYIRNRVMNRNMSKETIINAFDLCRKHGLQTNAINIIGLPDENDEMIWDTIKLNRRLRPTDTGANIFYPYKGTKLGDYCFEKCLVDIKLCSNFSNERRETVLNFPSEYRKKLRYYQRNWDALVYPRDLRRRIRCLLKGTILYDVLRDVKRLIQRR